MKKKSFKYFIFVFFFLSRFSSYSINDSLVNVINFGKGGNGPHSGFSLNLNGKQLINNISLNWLYFSKDNTNIKFNTLNDSGFNVIKQTILFLIDDEDDNDDSIPNSINFEGIAWYKLYFKMPLAQSKKVYSLFYNQVGASEIYLDGKLLDSFGKIGPDGKTIKSVNTDDAYISYYIGDTLTHVIAIRYSASNYKEIREKFNHISIGPYMKFSNSENFDALNNSKSLIFSVTNMLAAFFIALFLIHLLIFLFYREKTFNLYYSLFLLFLAMSFFELYYVGFIENTETFLWVTRIDKLFFPACCFFLVTLLNKLLNVKRSKHYIGLVILFCALILDAIFVWGFQSTMSTSIAFYTYFNTLAHSIQGIKRKVPSSKFLGWGVLSFSIAIVIAILLAILLAWMGDNSNSNYGDIIGRLVISDIIIAILSIPLSMTAYLAYDFARTNKSLKAQLETNQELSRKTIEQEIEKQELLANQNKILETQVEERTKEIATQNKVLEHQKKEITDSINYAKRIQQALLPDLADVNKHIPNSFILYLPKDIVSGDFYFFEKRHNAIYIAAADCTGHGVPGALMSMIVHEKLSYAISKFSEPSQILQSINQQVKDALKQTQSETASRDGCDIALCKITSTTVTYSGAYRPLYIFNKENEFTEIKATKTAIAGLTPYDQVFQESTYQIKDLKSIYIFSDGYADQFGGTKSKKLTTKKFKELLASVVNLPIQEQNQRLTDFFGTWKSNVEQIDDVLVVGISFSD